MDICMQSWNSKHKLDAADSDVSDTEETVREMEKMIVSSEKMSDTSAQVLPSCEVCITTL